MGIFSRIMSTRDKSEEKASLLAEDYLKQQEGGAVVEQQDIALEMLAGTISQEEHLEILIKEKDEIGNEIDELLKGREELIRAKNTCLNIGNKEFSEIVKTFDEYIECQDFKELPEKYSVIVLLREIAPELYENETLPITEIGMAVQEVYTSWSEIESSAKELDAEGEVLRGEIQNFAIAVNELKNKYKLSADWEGKKPAMMGVQTSLKERREQYLKKEAKIEEGLKTLYEDYAEIYDAFSEHCTYFVEALDLKINTFAKDKNRIERLQFLLNEKNRLEQKIEEYK